MAEIPSVTTVVVGDQLPWIEDSLAVADHGPFDAAAIHCSGARRDCVIRKISAHGATLECGVGPALGDKVAVELATGQRAPGKVAWVSGREVGVEFDDAIDVIALLNRKLVSQDRERRTMPRLEVRCPAHVKYGENFWPASLRNISSTGLQLEAKELPPLGTFVSILVEGLIIPPGEVIWRRGTLAGVELFEELRWSSIIPWVRQLIRKAGN